MRLRQRRRDEDEPFSSDQRYRAILIGIATALIALAFVIYLLVT